MTVELVTLVFEAAAPRLLAAFWADALGWHQRAAVDGDTIDLVATDVTRFGLRVQPGASDKDGQNRIHFDLTTTSVEDREATIAGLLHRGAEPIDIGQSPDEGHVVLADPEGNELCVIDPGNNFLAGCPRLGAVNCDGTSALGRFWSAALGWPLVWDQDEETAIQAPDGTGPKITWSGPPLMPRRHPERIHFHVAPGPGASSSDALGHLTSLGATRDELATRCPDVTALTDVDGNPFCLLPSP